jgi:quinol-cytochrome oxidoreductase complex cytochrome b subunit
VAEKIASWISERIPFEWDTLKDSLDEPVPRHMHKWWFCLGGTPLYLFMIQIVSGIALSFYYVPEPGAAFESVRYITQEAPFGWWVRGVHRWSSELMVVAVILHMTRVFLTGAYRRPRELNWLIGMGLLITVLTFGFTGYSLIPPRRPHHHRENPHTNVCPARGPAAHGGDCPHRHSPFPSPPPRHQ